MSTWSLSRTDTHCHRLQFDLSTGDFWVLLASDLHWDNAHCRLDLLKRHFDQAKERNAAICLFGDTFCAMQGKWDPRSSRDALRPEHHTGSYLDALVSTGAKWFKPYAKQIALISPGNHETAILKRHHVDLTQRLAQELSREGSTVEVGNYWGFLAASGLVEKKNYCLCRIHYHHGYGGGGEITRGLIDHSRTRSMYDADVYISGHIHRRNMDENILTRINHCGKIDRQTQYFLRSSTYKEEVDGWHAEKGRAARPIGAWWLRFYRVWNKDSKKKCRGQMRWQAIPTD